MSKRFNLREFQQQVLDRLQQQASGGTQVSTLGVQVGRELWLVNMTDISEVMPMPSLTPVPLTKPWYCGVSNVRGNLYSIVDLGAFLNGESTPREINNRVLLLGQNFAFNAGLIVSRVLGLRNASDWQQKDVGGRMQYQDEAGQTWYKLDINHLLQQPEFLQVGA